MHAPELLRLSRLSPTAFIRIRVLSFPVMLVSLLSGFKASVQTELNGFFAHLDNQADPIRKVSAQAFAKARQQLSHLAFVLLNERLLALVSEHWVTPRWQGLRVVAADASTLRLHLKDVSRRFVREAFAFGLYLPGLEMMLSCQLYDPAIGERQMLLEHLDKLAPDDLLVLDRGYPARWLIALLKQRGIPFCMRADQTGFGAVRDFVRSGAAEQVVTLGQPNAADCTRYGCRQEALYVRLVRVITPNGRVYALITSLLDSNVYPAHAFAALYHSRWRIEEAFKRLKHRLALENTSGLSWLAAEQDFGAKILADNLHSLTVSEAGNQVGIKEGYQVNRTYAFSHLKRCLPRWMLIAMPSTAQFITALTEIAKNLVAVIANISKPRPDHPKPHRKHAYKSTL